MRTFRVPLSMLGLLGWLTIVLAWYLVTDLRLVDPLFLSSPRDTLYALVAGIWSAELWNAALRTTSLAVLGFLLGVLFGVPLGLLLGGSRRFRSIFGGLIDYCRSIPSTALFPLFLLLCGVGFTSKLAVASYVSGLSITIYTAGAVPHFNSTRRFLLRYHNVPALGRVIDGLFFPAATGIAGGMRVALSMSLTTIVANEMVIGTDVGLGRYIYNAQLTFHISQMYAAIIFLGIVGVVLNRILNFLIKRAIWWHDFDQSEQ